MRMKKRSSQVKWILPVLLMVFMLGVCSRVLAVENDTKEKAVVRVGYTDYGQMIVEKNGEFSGYGVTYLQMLAAYTGWQYEYVPVTEENRLEELINGNIDLLCDVSEDRAGMEGLILSEENSCLYYGLICAKEDDTSIFFEEYEELNGKRIAVNKSRYMQEMLEEFAGDHQITYTPVYCSSFAEMEAAIEEGRADLMLASNQRDLTGYKYVAKAGVRNQFFAVSKDHPELMEQLNYADRQMKLKQPFIEALLYERYYGRPVDVLTGMTREEYELIQSGRKIRVVCDANSYPVEYLDEETGEYKGIYADAMRLIEKESGLQFEFVPVEQYKSSWGMLQSGEAEMSAGMYINDELANQYGLLYADSHISASYTMIAKVGVSLGGILKIALPENYAGIQAFVTETYPEWEIVQGKNVEDCLELVADGKADSTLVNSVFLQTAYNMNNYQDLAVFPMHSVDIPIRCAFAGENAELLRQIVNKAIKRIPDEAFKNCTIENSLSISYKPDLRDLMRETLPIILGILGGVIALYLISLWLRERHFRHMAMTDTVTGLWNGVCFRGKAKEELSRNRQKSYQLISMDMEHFKYVNNDFGEKVADNVLVVIAERLRKKFGKKALYAREMGDQFFILTERRTDIEEVLGELAGEIIFDNNGMEQRYKPAMKFGIYNIEANNRESQIGQYIDAAVSARKSIKRDHTKQIAYFDDKMESDIRVEAQIEKKMESALKQGEFVVYYQPKYLLKTEKIIGAEALIRWNHPKEGLIPPGVFIPIFERNGFIVQTDFFVYEEVLKMQSRRLKEGKKTVPVSVNVSRTHIGTSDFLPRLMELADRYEVPRELLELELTETALGGKQQNIVDFIRACKHAGFPISIDDFGSGYSSLNLLKEMPVDVLKIDREFLNETDESQKSSVIVEQVVEMATKIDIRTLCEGVETKEQAAFLKQIGCNMAQGYLYSKPVPEETFEGMLESEI